MAFELVDYVLGIELPHTRKLVLIVYAWHANGEKTNLAWPSRELVRRETGLADSTLSAAIADLGARGLLIATGKSVGGRGKTQIYRVAPAFHVPSTNPPTAGGFSGNPPTAGEYKPPDSRVVSEETPRQPRSIDPETPRLPGKNPPAAGDRTPIEPEPSRAHAREAESPTTLAPALLAPAGTDSTSERLAALTGAIERTLRTTKGPPRGTMTGADLSTWDGVNQEREAQLAAARRYHADAETPPK